MPTSKMVSNLKKRRVFVIKKRVLKAPAFADPIKVERAVFAPGKYPGKIEITQGFGVLASLSFQFGEKLKMRPVEVRNKDIYVDAGSLDALRVGTQYRRQGLATQLMTELINYVKRQKVGDIYLRVNKHNLAALRVYNKLGFKVVREMNSSEQLMAFYRS